VARQERIEGDLRQAMKARDRQRTSALRMLLSALRNRAVADGLGPQGSLDDEVVTEVISSELKRRREAAGAYRDGGREEQAAGEEAEATVYEAYLPAQLTDDELGSIVDEAIDEAGADSVKQMGQVMKLVMGRVRGRADGAKVSGLVRERLGG